MANGRTRIATFGAGFIGGVAVFCAFAVVAWILFRFLTPAPTYEDKRSHTREEKLAAIRKDAQEKLYGPAKYIDKAKGTVQIPIDTAMDLVVADYQAKPVQPSQVKVENPYPVGLQAPAAAPAAAKPAASPATAAPAPAAAAPTAAAPAAPAAQPMTVTTAPVAIPLASPATSPEVKP